MNKIPLNLGCGSLACLALVFLLPGCGTPAAEQPVRLKVMTYNVRIGVGGGEWHTDPQRINLEPVARVIAEHGPDIVGLQEVDQFRKRSAGMNQSAWMAGRLKMNVAFVPAYSVPTEVREDEHYGVALLARQPMLPPERVPLYKPDYRQSHPQYPDYFSEQRVLLVAPVKVGNRQIHVLVTHLGLTVDQRERQVREIAEVAARIPGPKILLGDFNAEPDEPAMRDLQASFQDALTVVRATSEERKSYPGGLRPTGAIDYIFVSPEFRVLNARVIRDATLASDHNPVVAELKLPAK
jgi:endonuclease/exonuclease/phosphatase family metal-dependent hydrolase